MDYFYVFKKLVARFCDPLTLILVSTMVLVVVTSLKADWVSYRIHILGAAFIFLWLASTPAISHLLLFPLEKEAQEDAFDPNENNADAILVLGCGHREVDALPLSSRYKECSLTRVVHAHLLHNETGLPVYFSGGVLIGNKHSEADYNHHLATLLGLKEDKGFVVADTSEDTSSEAHLLADVFSGKSIVLVTSAAHMARSKKYMEDAGVKVLASPTDHKITFMEINYRHINAYLPNKNALTQTNVALYEYLGMFSQRLFGK